MNEDAVKVSQINPWTALPSLRLIEALPLGSSAGSLLPCVFGLWALVLLSTTLSPPAAIAERSVFAEVLPDAIVGIISDSREIAVVGVGAGITRILRLLISVVVVGFVGTAVSRSAGMRFCKDPGTGAIQSLVHASRLWKSTLLTSGLFGLLSFMSLLPFRIVAGLFFVASGSGDTTHVFSIVVWAAALTLMIAMFICAVGWLLSLASVGVDRCGGAESLSRGISYVLSRFWRTTCYVGVVILLSWLSGRVFEFILTQAAVLAEESIHGDPRQTGPASTFLQVCSILVHSVRLSVFFSGLAISYVLLRHFEDNVSLQETDSGSVS